MKKIFFLTTLLLLLMGCDDSKSIQNPDPGFSCNDCDSSYQICNTARTTCNLLAGKCNTKDDCTDTTKPVCDDNHTCIAETIIFDCNSCDSSYQQCNTENSACILQNGKCDTKDDCTDTTKPVCDDTHTCIAETIIFDCSSCNSNYQKCNPEKTACILQDGKCDTKDDCTDDTKGVCNDNHTCVAPIAGSIYPIRTGTIDEGTDVTITGTITALDGDQKIYIQEPGNEYRGIMIYAQDGGSGFIIGDQIEVSGEYIEYNDLSEIKIANFNALKNLDNNSPITTYTTISSSDLSKRQVEPYESMLVILKGSFTVVSHDDDGNTTMVDSEENNFLIHRSIFNYQISPGDKLTEIRGILGYTYNNYKVFPLEEDDLVDESVLCDALTCGDNQLCVIENSVASCQCNEKTGYFENSSNICVNPCVDFSNTCTETNRTRCTPHGPNEGDFTCRCDKDHEENDEGVCVKVDCVRMRLMAANITDGSPQRYDETGIRIFQGFKPDIVMIQEFNYKDKDGEESDVRELVDIAFGEDYYFVRGYADDKNLALDNYIPNGIVSKWPIIDYGSWGFDESKNRDMDWAIVDIPGERDIFVISVHLRTKSAYQKPQSIIIADEVAAIKDANPEKYYYVVGGDFNGTSAVSDDGFGKNGDFYVDGPHPVNEDGYEATNISTSQLDFIIPGVDFQELHKPLILTNPNDETDIFRTHNNGLVFKSTLYSQSDLDRYLPPIQTSDVNSHQHMAIIKYFSTCSE